MGNKRQLDALFAADINGVGEVKLIEIGGQPAQRAHEFIVQQINIVLVKIYIIEEILIKDAHVFFVEEVVKSALTHTVDKLLL